MNERWSEPMRHFTIPPDAAEQGRQLIESGVAERVLLEVKKRPGYEDLTVGDCQFWARVFPNDMEIRKPQLQVIVSYPSRREDDPLPRRGHGVTVATENNPWLLTDGDTLAPEQLDVVRHLAADGAPIAN